MYNFKIADKTKEGTKISAEDLIHSIARKHINFNLNMLMIVASYRKKDIKHEHVSVPYYDFDEFTKLLAEERELAKTVDDYKYSSLGGVFVTDGKIHRVFTKAGITEIFLDTENGVRYFEISPSRLRLKSMVDGKKGFHTIWSKKMSDHEMDIFKDNLMIEKNYVHDFYDDIKRGL